MVANNPYFNSEEIELEVEPFSVAFQTEIIDLLQELGKDGFSFFEEIELDVDDELKDDNTLLVKIAKANSFSDSSIKIAKELLS